MITVYGSYHPIFVSLSGLLPFWLPYLNIPLRKSFYLSTISLLPEKKKIICVVFICLITLYLKYCCGCPVTLILPIPFVFDMRGKKVKAFLNTLSQKQESKKPTSLEHLFCAILWCYAKLFTDRTLLNAHDNAVK